MRSLGNTMCAALLALVIGAGAGVHAAALAAMPAAATASAAASALANDGVAATDAAAASAPASASSSRPPHVLHAFLSTGETGLDPAVASDIASLSLMENLFDPLLRYAYLARPVKLQANTVTAMPKVDDHGLTYTFQLRHGIYFTPDPAFKGARREVTAQDYVYSLKRLYDPALKSPWLFLFEGKIAGDAALAPGKFGQQRRRARSGGGVSGTGRQSSGRHRAVRDGRVEAQRQDQPAGQSRFPRDAVPCGRRRHSIGRARAGRVAGRQAAAAAGPHRHQDRRGIPVAHAGFPRRRIRFSGAGAGVGARHGHERQRAQAGAGAARHRADAVPGAANVLYVDEYGRSADRRLQQGQGGAAARHRARLRQPRGCGAAQEGTGAAGAVAAAAERAGLRRGVSQPARLRSGAGARAARPLWLPNRRRRFPHPARRQAADLGDVQRGVDRRPVAR